MNLAIITREEVEKAKRRHISKEIEKKIAEEEKSLEKNRVEEVVEEETAATPTPKYKVVKLGNPEGREEAE